MLRVVKTKYGMVEGLPAADPRITSFKGIPFAAPPVGKNRWRAPQPCKPWEGVLKAYAFKAISVQDRPGLGTDIYCREWHVDSGVEISEDNLYLNIWTPAKTGDEKLPVFVWYFGGGFQWGYPSEMEFDGERLARRGVIVVSVNYRLNVFGFLSHPEITAQDKEHPTNFGLLDQQAGTRWVYENIAAFGGDPENITIGGQSAGGGSVMSQVANLENKGLFKKAIIMSGLIGSPYQDGLLPPQMTLKEAEEWGSEFFSYLGVKSLEEARQIDADTMLEKYNAFKREKNKPMLFATNDGCFIKGDPMVAAMEGRILDIPIMAGNTVDEFTNGITAKDEAELEKEAKRLFGESDAKKFLGFKEAHEKMQDGRFAYASGIELSDKNLFEVMQKNGSKNPFYYYRFNADIPGEDNPGTFHSVDLWFFFETLAKCSRPYEGHHYDLARHMANYWTNFMKTGDPNGEDANNIPMQQWNPYTKEDGFEMEFTKAGAVSRKETSREYKAFLREKMLYEKRKLQEKRVAYNPYLPSFEYVPDGEPYVFGDRVFIYGSHDKYNGDVFCEGDFVCYSAPIEDLGAWRYEGVIYRKDQEPLNPEGDGMLYAPDVTIGPDGRYYLYYVCSNIGNVSVAVCDSPAGKYEFYGHVKYEDGTLLGNREGDEPQFDPGVLTEGKTTYLYTGFCAYGDKSRHGAMCTVLKEDMITIAKAPTFVVPGCMYSKGSGFEGHEYFEAASIRKKDGKYYFVYSSIVMHELCYAISDRPDGDFKYAGVLISNCDLGIDTYKKKNMVSAFGANNHGSIIEINEQWYVFYHRHTNGTWYSRQVCAEKLVANEDGTFMQAELTSCGLHNGALPAKGYYPTYIACNLFYPQDEKSLRDDNMALQPNPTQVKIVQDREDGKECEAYITNITQGACVGFKYFDFKDVKTITTSLHGYASGKLEVRLSPEGEIVGEGQMGYTNTWRECCIPVSIPDGVHALYFTFKGDGSLSMKGLTLW